MPSGEPSLVVAEPGAEASLASVRRMVEALAPRIASLVARTADRALEEIPEYSVLSAEELREGVGRDLALAIQALVNGRQLTGEDRAVMSTIGDTRARQGLPLEGMLRVYRITVDEIFCALWAAVEDGELDPAEVLQLTRLVWAYAGPMMDIATAAYREREIEQAVNDSQRRTALVHELLLSPASSQAAATALGLDPLREHITFRARTPAGSDGLLSELALPGVLDAGIVAPYEGDIIGVAARRPNLVPAAGVMIGVGPAGGLGELPGSFLVATRVVDTAAAFGLAGVLRLDDMPLHAVVRAEPGLGAGLYARYVDPVAVSRAGGAEVLDTVRAFLAHELNAEAAAEALAVHPNTVRNRLHRYESLANVSLRSLDDLTHLRLALLHAELLYDGPPA